jgi:hypothetical protein
MHTMVAGNVRNRVSYGIHDRPPRQSDIYR